MNLRTALRDSEEEKRRLHRQKQPHGGQTSASAGWDERGEEKANPISLSLMLSGNVSDQKVF